MFAAYQLSQDAIESNLCESAYILQTMVIGQDQKHLGALLVPHIETFQKEGFKVGGETGFKPFERVAAWRLLPRPFEVGDELTSTYKLKRHVMNEKYRDLIASVYPPVNT